MITPENKAILMKRFKSLVWRLAMMAGAILVDFILANLGLLDLSTPVVGFIGLVLGEVSKYLNKAAK